MIDIVYCQNMIKPEVIFETIASWSTLMGWHILEGQRKSQADKEVLMSLKYVDLNAKVVFVEDLIYLSTKIKSI